MECEEFLQNFSDFFDSEFEKHPPDEYKKHLECCARCGEYDRVVRGGLRLVRELDAPEPVPDLMLRLQRSFLAQRDRSAVVGEYAKAAGVAGVAIAAVLFLAVNPILGPGGEELELPPVIVQADAMSGQSHSLWGPPPRFSVSASFLTTPGPSEGSSLQRPLERFSLFREPVRASLGGVPLRAGRSDGERDPAEVAPE
ncbi:MAG: hypothetical protein PVI01_15285 [Gemmatimonadales bacterium]|jgi:hypothetical protein